MVAKQQIFAVVQWRGQRDIACFAGGGLHAPAGATVDLHAQYLARHAQCGAEALAVPCPCSTVRVQPMIDMQRAQSAHACFGQLRQRMQQGAGIRAAAEGDAQCRWRHGRQRGVQMLVQRIAHFLLSRDRT